MSRFFTMPTILACVFCLAVLGWYSATDDQQRRDFVRELFSSQR